MRKHLSTVLYLIDFGYLAMATGWGLCLVGYLCSLVFTGKFLQAITGNQYLFLDFSKYYAFAKISLSADRLQIFDPAIQWKWAQIVAAPAKLQFPFFSEYPPYLAPIFVPLTLMPLGYAYLVWLAISAGSACAVVYWLARKYSNQSRLSAVGLAIGMFASVNALWATLLGQLNWLMVTLTGTLFAGLVARKWIANGLSLAVMSLKPQYAVFFLSSCATRASWKSIAMFVAAEAVLAVAGGLSVGFENVFGYPSVVLSSHGQGDVHGHQLYHYSEDQNFLIGIRRLVTLVIGQQPLSYSLLLMFASMIGLAWLWNRYKSQDASRWLMSVTILTFLLVNPHCHLHDCVCIGVAAALTMPTVSLRGMQEIPDRLHRIWCHILYFYPVVAWAGFAMLFQQSLFRTLFFLIANLVLLVLGLVILHRKEQQHRGPKLQEEPA